MEKLSITERRTAEMIGHLCAVWASLDHSANMLIRQVLNCTEQQAACIATQIEPVAARMRLLKTLIMTIDQSTEWREMALGWLNRIEGQVAAKRNRIIHDAWDFDAARPVQLDRRAKIGRPQSRQPLQLITEVRSEASPKSIYALIEEVTLCATALLAARADVVAARSLGQRPAEDTLLAQMPEVERLQRQEAQTREQSSPAPSEG